MDLILFENVRFPDKVWFEMGKVTLPPADLSCSPLPIPIVRLRESAQYDICHPDCGLQLRRLDLLWPAPDHPHAAVEDRLLAHGVRGGVVLEWRAAGSLGRLQEQRTRTAHGAALWAGQVASVRLKAESMHA